MGHFIITGTSRGIGEALAKTLLDDKHCVFGISRGSADTLSQYENYSHFKFDLSETSHIEHMLIGIFEQIKIEEVEMICLINNAAMVEPLKSIGDCSTDEISRSITISLIAPIVLSSCFIKKTDYLNARRKIINISSGSGIHPLQDMSIYCTAKAGLNMFTRCVGVEQMENENPVEIIAVNPGMIDTEMQKTARGMSAEDFAMGDFFREAYINGELQLPQTLVNDIKKLINNQYETGRIMNHFEG